MKNAGTLPLLLVAALVWAAHTGHAQTQSIQAQAQPAPTAPSRPAAAAAPAAPSKPLTFDVVSVRPVHTDTRGFGPVFPKGGDSMVMQFASPEWTIRRAYDINRDNRILGLPDWAKESNWQTRYDIQAKIAEADIPAWKTMTDAQPWQVVQRLLADRFQLKLHHETVQRPIYALVLAKGGARMKLVPPPPDGKRGWMEAHAPGVDIFHGVMIDYLVGRLSGSGFGLGREVFDRTGLTGNYDFTLTYAPVTASAPADSAAPQSAYPDIFTAVQEELGLKLEPATGPIDILVVDHIERPSEN